MTTTDTGRRAEPSRGRKRDDDRTQAILDAAGTLLLEVGFDHFRIQDVAERAGSGTGAIYRRWETKEALVADAIRALPDPDADQTGDPVADLRALLSHKACMAADNPDLLPGAVVAIRSDERVAAAFRDRYTCEPYRQAIARILGDDHPHLDLLAELAPAITLHRTSIGGQPIDPDEITDQVVALITDLAAPPS